MVSWTQFESGYAPYAATYDAAHQQWSRPVALGERADSPSTRVAMDPNGNAVAVWSTPGPLSYNTEGTGAVWVAMKNAGADRWSAPQDITGGASYGLDASSPAVAVDDKGNVVVLWARSKGGFVVQAVIHDRAAKTWSAPQDVSLPTAGFVPSIQVAVDARGNAVAVWGLGPVDTASYDAAARRWSAPQNLSPAHQSASNPQLAMNPQGDAVAVWDRFEGAGGTGTGAEDPQYFAVAATRPAGGAWSLPRDLATDAGSSDSAIDPQGNALAVWGHWDASGTYFIQAAGYDVGGPELRELAIPQGASAGSPVSFSVAPFDRWSAVSSVSWDFGDGSRASGNSVAHSYAAPGSYVVTVTATDAVGNASSARRTVQVAGGGPSAPAPASPSSPGQLRGGDWLGQMLASEARRTRDLRGCLAKAQAASRPRGKGRITPRARRRAAVLRRSARQRCLKVYGRTPGRVTGLSARVLSSTKIALSFTAPGTDGPRPPAARGYLITQALGAIRSTRGFARAQSLCKGSCRFSVTQVGATVTLTITDLRPRTTYYYAVAARDNVSGKLGPRSPTVRVRTR